MLSLSRLLLAVLLVGAPAVAAQSYQAAMAELEIGDGTGERNLAGFVWYPTTETGPIDVDFESAVWVSSFVVKDAEPADGPFPFLALSHGMFGNALNQAWFAAEMARRGYVVAAIDHPGTSTWSRDPDQRRQLWQRPKDNSRLIDFAVSSDALPAAIDPNQVVVAGHSLGGFTVVGLAGARFDSARLNRFCEANPGELACGIFAEWNIAQTPRDRAAMEADISDPRIRAFAVFDLGGTQAFSDESLKSIDRPMLVFGAPIMNSGLALETESRALVEALSSDIVRYVEPEQLSHFDFLGRCKPGGRALLAKEEPGDEVVCDRGGAQREQMHQLIINEVAAFFASVLQ